MMGIFGLNNGRDDRYGLSLLSLVGKDGSRSLSLGRKSNPVLAKIEVFNNEIVISVETEEGHQKHS